MKRKGYIFLIDAIFAIVILVIGYLLVSSSYSVKTTELPLSIYTENTMNLFSSVKINEICSSSCSCSNPKLEGYCPNFIRNPNQTLLDYFGELYYMYDSTNSISYKNRAKELFENLTIEHGMFRQDVMGVKLSINDEEIYSNSNTEVMSKNLISYKKMSFGYYELPDTGQTIFWGPYIIRLDIWEK